MTNTGRKLILLVAICISIISIKAQKFNSFGGIRFGYALPMGQFASHDFGTGAYALLGKSISGEAAWFITPEIGFGVDISASTFGFASGFYAEDYLENEPSYQTMDLLSGPYSVKTFMGGIYYKIHYGRDFFSTFKLMGGLFSARTPDQFYGVVDAMFLQQHFFWKTGSLERTVSFLTGASFEYNVFEHVSLLLQADFVYAQPSFKYESTQGMYTENIKMPIFKLLPGINIRF